MQLKKFHIGTYELSMLAIVLLASLLRVLFISLHWPATTSDEGIMDLMALHIANHGEHPIFFYGQAYMGSLEAYIGALLFKIFGVSVFSVRLGLIPFFALFLVCIYFLTRLLYNRPLALFTLVILSLGSSDIVPRQLKAIGGYPEVVFFAAFIFLVASKLALTSQPSRHRHIQLQRGLLYASLGFMTGLALWVDQLILPFIATAALLLLLFCTRELFSRAGLYTLLGIIIGALPLIYYNLTSPFDHNSLAVLLKLQHAGLDELAANHIPRIQQLVGAFLVSLPMVTSFQLLCPVAHLPMFGPGTAQTLQCTLLQGGWSLGYCTLWISAVLLAGYTLWQLWRQQPHTWSFTERQTTIKECARLLLLLSAALSFALYALSPGAALYPTTNTRYLICMLVATPALLWPLWHDFDLHRAAIQYRWLCSFILRVGLLLLIVAMFAGGTVNIVKDIPDAQATYATQQALIDHLEHIGATRIYSEYWTCYRLAFQSDEHIICANLNENLTLGGATENRYPPYYEQVKAVTNPTYVFPTTSIQAHNFARQVQMHNIQHYTYHEFAGYAIYQFTTPPGIP
jgi:hypothetical protein